MLTNKSEIIKIEEEKADNKYRKTYLSNVAHEFKAPIQVLMITVSELSKLNFPDSALDLFKDIENLGNYILILIMAIISFAKENTGVEVKINRFSASSPFKFAFQILQLLIRNNNNKCYSVTPRINLDKNLPEYINTDESRLKQVLVNLVSNAYKFTLSGVITINVSKQNSYRNIYDEILVEIIDTGIGIKESDECKIFKQFGKLEDKQNLNKQGTGLGLSICRNIIERIGIELGYRRNDSVHGSIFYFTFLSIKNTEDWHKLADDKYVKMKDCVEEWKKPKPYLNIEKFENKSDNILSARPIHSHSLDMKNDN